MLKRSLSLLLESLSSPQFYFYIFFLDSHRFDPVLEKAILFAVGNTLVCDDLDEAKQLSWSGQRFKGIIVI